MTAAAWLGHRIRELKLYAECLLGSGPTVLVSVGDSVPGFSSDLRGRAVVQRWRSVGVNALVVPPQFELKQRVRLNRLLCPKVVVHQKFRIPGNDPSLYPDAVNIVDLDDADFLSSDNEQRMAALAGMCSGGIGGSRFTRAWLSEHVGRTAVIWTGAPSVRSDYPPPSSRAGNRVFWAIPEPLQAEREAAFVRDVVQRCGSKCKLEFVVVGRGESSKLAEYFAPALREGATFVHYPFMPYGELVELLKTGSVGLAPLFIETGGFNQGKSFGKVLAYLAAGVPTTCSDAVDHDLFFKHDKNGFVSNDVSAWAGHIEALLTQPSLRDRVVAAATEDFRRRLSVDEYCARALAFIESVYLAERRSPLRA
jgi:Glycosyl transferases group 1